MPDRERAPLRLWDLPVRIVHWSFVLLLPALWWTAEEGDLDTHMILGIVMLGLVAFRILWGFAGSATARFAGFVRGPGAILAYLRGKAEPVVGHNPLGGLSVIALLALLAVQTGLGLFAQDDDGLTTGPLNSRIDYDLADRLTEMHETLFNVILALVVLHIAAILYYHFVKRDNLVGPMLTGRKAFDAGTSEPRIASTAIGFACAITAAGLSYWLSLGAPLP